jgi:hypothetical protein
LKSPLGFPVAILNTVSMGRTLDVEEAMQRQGTEKNKGRSF